MKKWIIGGIIAGGVLALIAVATFYLVAYVILSVFIFGPPPLSPAEKKQVFENFYRDQENKSKAVLPLSRPYVLSRKPNGQWYLGKIRLEQSYYIVGISNQVVSMNMHKQFLIAKVIENEPDKSIHYWQIFNLSREVDSDSGQITKDNLNNELEKLGIPINVELKHPEIFYHKFKQTKRCHWFPKTDMVIEGARTKK